MSQDGVGVDLETSLGYLLKEASSALRATYDELMGKARAELQAEAKSATDALVALRSERGRVMALLRHRGRADQPHFFNEVFGNPRHSNDVRNGYGCAIRRQVT